MQWHWPKPYCQNEEQHEDKQRCLGSDGHRKLFVDPRRAVAVTNHEVEAPKEGGLDLPFADMRHDHFHVSVRGEGKGRGGGGGGGKKML